MTESIDHQLDALRTEYVTADATRRAELAKTAEELKAKACYHCKQYPYTEEHLPFCSASCHETWAQTNYKADNAIEERVARAKEIAAELRAKKYPQSTLATPMNEPRDKAA